MEIFLEGLDCANCAEKIRKAAERLDGVKSAEMNFITKKLSVSTDSDNQAEQKAIFDKITAAVKSLEPDVKASILDKNADLKKTTPQESFSDEMKMMIIRLAVTAVLFIFGLLSKGKSYELWLFLSAYFIVGLEVLKTAGKNIIKGKAFDENFLMALASLGAFFIGEFPEGVAVMFLYQIGEMFQDYAVRHSRKSISDLMNIRPDYANIKRDGEIVRIPPEQAAVGDIILIKAGEKIPLDAVIVSGESSVDTSALTGESIPRLVHSGDAVLSGCVNLSGYIEAAVTKEFGESTVSKILELVENSAAKKARSENFITRFAQKYTPCVVIAAVLLAVIPMLIEGGYNSEWLYRALSFLVVSCPCALVISVPLSFFGGIGGASSIGVLVKGGNSLEALSQCGTVVFDKTGTLTSGSFDVTKIVPNDIGEEELLALAAYAESKSNHPAALSIMKKYSGDVPNDISHTEIAGKGVKAVTLDGKTIYAGNRLLMQEESITVPQITEQRGTLVYVAAEGRYQGYLHIEDAVKPDAAKTVSRLKQSGIHTVMLTGDRSESARSTAQYLGIDEFKAELLPADKVYALEKIMSSRSSVKTAFVGDGINDAPVLMRADIGIAMGSLGSDAAIEAADIVIMTDEPSRILDAVKISKKTRAIVMQNIVFALGVKFLVLILAALGITSMWAAVFADVGVSVIAVMNAMRARKINTQ